MPTRFAFFAPVWRKCPDNSDDSSWIASWIDIYFSMDNKEFGQMMYGLLAIWVCSVGAVCLSLLALLLVLLN